jgi:hypothetical protein
MEGERHTPRFESEAPTRGPAGPGLVWRCLAKRCLALRGVARPCLAQRGLAMQSMDGRATGSHQGSRPWRPHVARPGRAQPGSARMGKGGRASGTLLGSSPRRPRGAWPSTARRGEAMRGQARTAGRMAYIDVRVVDAHAGRGPARRSEAKLGIAGQGRQGDWQPPGFEALAPTRGLAGRCDAGLSRPGLSKDGGRMAYIDVRVVDAHAWLSSSMQSDAMRGLARLSLAMRGEAKQGRRASGTLLGSSPRRPREA